MRRRLLHGIAAGAAVIALSAAPAAADLLVSGALGGNTPLGGGGSTGYSSLGQILTTVISSRVLLGAEFEYNRYQSTFLGIDDVDVDAYNLRAVLQVLLFPTTITPYLGVGVGVNVIDVDDPRLSQAFGGANIDTVGAGFGAIAFAGIQFPIGDHFSLFSEARTSLVLNGDKDLEGQLGTKDLSSFSAVAGVRLRF